MFFKIYFLKISKQFLSDSFESIHQRNFSHRLFWYLINPCTINFYRKYLPVVCFQFFYFFFFFMEYKNHVNSFNRSRSIENVNETTQRNKDLAKFDALSIFKKKRKNKMITILRLVLVQLSISQIRHVNHLDPRNSRSLTNMNEISFEVISQNPF